MEHRENRVRPSLCTPLCTPLYPFALLVDLPVVDTGLLDLHESETRLNLAGRQIAVTNHQPVALAVTHASVTIYVFSDLVLNGGGQHLLGPLPQDVGQNISRHD